MTTTDSSIKLCIKSSYIINDTQPAVLLFKINKTSQLQSYFLVQVSQVDKRFFFFNISNVLDTRNTTEFHHIQQIHSSLYYTVNAFKINNTVSYLRLYIGY